MNPIPFGQDFTLAPPRQEADEEAELRRLFIQFLENCPPDCQQASCPFRPLNGLYYGSLRTLINNMSPATILSLLEINPHIKPSRPVDDGNPAGV